MATRQEVTLKKMPWLPKVAAALSRALGDDLREVGGEVVSGVSECWEWVGVGYCITRLEISETGREFVLVAAEGRGFYTPQTMNLNDGLVIRIADANGADRVRINTRRPSIGRFLTRYGWQEKLDLGESEVYGQRVKQ
jgi:hypothetical protein